MLVRVYADSGAIDFSREDKAVSRAAEQNPLLQRVAERRVISSRLDHDGRQHDSGRGYERGPSLRGNSALGEREVS